MTEEKQMVENALEHEMIEVHTSLYKPFYDFLKEYLAFYGTSKTMEELCRQVVYNHVRYLYGEFKTFLANLPPTYLQRDRLWAKKWDYISLTCISDDEEEKISSK